MGTKARRAQCRRTAGLADAVAIVDCVDGYRDLNGAIPVLLFLTAGGVAARSFFWLVDLATWIGLDRLDPVLPSSVSFVLVFLIWALGFLAAVSLLEWLRIGNVGQIAKNRLSALELSADELDELQAYVRSATWRHDRAIKKAVGELEPA